jgi:hypothetical protein
MFKTITFLLFSQLAIGGALTIALVPDQASKGFFRFCGAACALLLAVALLVSENLAPNAVAGLSLGLLLLILFVILIVLDKPGVARNVLYVAILAGCGGLVSHAISSVPQDWPTWVSLASPFYVLASAAFLGSVIFAMTLGHWYLVVPTLPIGPLRTLTRLMIWSTIAKGILLGLVLYLGSNSEVVEISETIAGFGRLQGLFFWARVLFGLIGPIIICYMTWETVKLNATQSATGLLYVATILVLIGETLSRFIYFTTHLPV